MYRTNRMCVCQILQVDAKNDRHSLRAHEPPAMMTMNHELQRPISRLIVRRANVAGRNSPHENSSHELTPSEWSDWSEEGNLPAGCRGIVNPNYPGFQHLAPSLLSDIDLTEDDSCSDSPPLHHHDEVSSTRLSENDNEYNNNIDNSINHLCGQRNDRKIFYEKPKFNIQVL